MSHTLTKAKVPVTFLVELFILFLAYCIGDGVRLEVAVSVCIASC